MAKKKRKSTAKKCPGIGTKGRLRKGYKHRKGGLKRGCPIKAKK